MRYNSWAAATGVLLLSVSAAWGQKERADIRQGNRAYYEGKYPEAEVGYKRAIEKNINSYEANFNLGGALYKQERYDDAAATYEKLAQDGSDRRRQAATYYNLGNTYVRQRQIDQAIEAYKNALRLVPEDREAKLNLAYAQKLKQQQDQNQNQNNQDQNQNQNQDQNQNGGGGGGNDDRNNRDQNQNQDQNGGGGGGNDDRNRDQNKGDSDPNDQNDGDSRPE
ncbi:MAG: tetratricopeptide repeat protein, partial [Rikenella sp.]|nr:tetratricopeptide repeat protein [Rikenella sp.]